MKFKDVFLWLIIGFVFIGVLTHAYGFSLAAGTLFSGTNTLGKTLEGQGSASGGTKVR
jgi:hypothetical protein